MVCFQKYCAILITAALILSAVPVYHSEDASRDNRVDLRDVIMLIQGVSAENHPSSRPASLRDLMSSIQVVAGMKTVIQASDDRPAFSRGDASCYLPSAASGVHWSGWVAQNPQLLPLFKHHPDEAPTPPPPEPVCAA